MKYTCLVAGIGLALAGSGKVQADTVEQRVEGMEGRLEAMQQRLDEQSRRIREQEAAIERQQAVIETAGPALAAGSADQGVEIVGLLEMEAGYHSPYQGDSESDLSLATFELGIFGRLGAWLEAGGTLLFEQGETDLEVDTGYVTLANAEVSPLFVTVGRIYLPFGAFDSNLVSDPLTLELGETRETALQAGFETGGLEGSLFLFNGTNQKDGHNRVDAWGANLAYAHEWEGGGWTLGAGYLSDLGDSDGLQDLIADNRGDNDITRRIGGWTLNTGARFGRFNLFGEYLASAARFDAGDVPWRTGGANPRAFNLEVGYGFDLLGRGATLALAYQGSREALALEMPRERWLLGLSLDLLENTALFFEWAHDTDYAETDGGTGRRADTLTVQLAVEF